MTRDQLPLFISPPRYPEGLRYGPDLLSVAEERELVAQLAQLPFRQFEFRGFTGKRRVVSFGWRYDFNDRRIQRTADMPGFLLPLRDRAGAFAEVAPADFRHVLVTEYPPGATIGWHRDRPEFGDVVGISLLTPCVFRLRRRKGPGWERASLTVDRRSAYLLRASARTDWEHSISAVTTLRYSITFRTLRPADRSEAPQAD